MKTVVINRKSKEVLLSVDFEKGTKLDWSVFNDEFDAVLLSDDEVKNCLVKKDDNKTYLERT